MTINELREKRNQAWNAAKAFVETKRDKDGLLSEEDAKTYAQMEKKVQDYGAEIERMEAMSAMEAQLNRPTSSPITEKPMNGKSTADEHRSVPHRSRAWCIWTRSLAVPPFRGAEFSCRPQYPLEGSGRSGPHFAKKRFIPSTAELQPKG